MWARNGRWILPEIPDFHVAFRDLLHAVNLRHGTDGFTSPPKEGVLRIFSPWKNPTASAGFEPANLGTKGQHPTYRPPKPLFSFISQTQDLVDADLEKYSEIKNITADFYMVIKLHRLITVEYKN